MTRRKAQSFFSHLLLAARFLKLGLSTTHVHADWLLNRSSAAKWAQPLITYYQVAALVKAQSYFKALRGSRPAAYTIKLELHAWLVFTKKK